MTSRHATRHIDAKDQLNQTQIDSFHNRAYTQIKLSKGDIIWRFGSQKEYRIFSDFWIDGETMSKIMRSLHHSQNFSQGFKKENIRNSLNILEPWNKLNWRCKVQLKKEVIAYKGVVGTQIGVDKDYKGYVPFNKAGAVVEKSIEYRRGRDVQYVIPRFKGLKDKNEWGELMLKVHI